MKAFSVRVSPEVAKTRPHDGGTRNVRVVLQFSAAPQVWLGDLPPEIADNAGLRVVELTGSDALAALDQPVHALGAHLGRLRSPATAARSANAGDMSDLLRRVEHLVGLLEESLEAPPDDVPDMATLEQLDRAALDEMHHQVVGRRPNPNTGDDKVRDAIRKASAAGTATRRPSCVRRSPGHPATG